MEISTPCGRKWLRQRTEIGENAYHQTRKLSNTLGRPQEASKEQIQALVDPSKNPYRDQPLEAQINFFQLPIKKRQVRNRLKQDTRKGRIYKAAFVGKDISKKNEEERTDYGKEHQAKTISEFWAWIFFSDECHLDPTSQSAPQILREEGTRYAPENILQRPKKKGVQLHVAAWINWWGKSKKLWFYNDEEDHEEQPKIEPRPRRRPTTESEEAYQARIKEWEAKRPHKVNIIVGGNHMTQKYYTEKLLPQYIQDINEARIYYNEGAPWLFQEDGDPSHGIRKPGLAFELKKANWISNLKHPAQSPDLNPMEGIWNILKQRIRHRILRSEEDYRTALQEEWDKITLEEIRERIRDMPRRCDLLVSTGGKPIKLAMW